MTIPIPIRHKIRIPYSEGMLSGVPLTPPFPGHHPADRDVTINVFADAGHLITHPSTGETAPGCLALITDWLKQRVKVQQTTGDTI